MIKTVYKTSDTVIADVVVNADNEGKTDATEAIQTAIAKVSSVGGGTVFLPTGKYLITGEINIPSYLTLCGDRQCPETEKTAYGTVIRAKPSALGSQKPQDKPLIKLSGNSGMSGLTFYYSELDDSFSVKYGYTIYADNPVTATMKNLTFINSCYGIGVSLNSQYNEPVNLENVYGTFLYNAVAHNATTDVGFYDNVNVDCKY